MNMLEEDTKDFKKAYTKWEKANFAYESQQHQTVFPYYEGSDDSSLSASIMFLSGILLENSHILRDPKLSDHIEGWIYDDLVSRRIEENLPGHQLEYFMHIFSRVSMAFKGAELSLALITHFGQDVPKDFSDDVFEHQDGLLKERLAMASKLFKANSKK